MRLLSCVVVTALMFGCGSWQGKIRKQAASDFACPDADVTLTPLRSGVEERSARATGCGRQATYVCSTEQCMRNSDVSLVAEDSGVSAAVAAFASRFGPALRNCAGLVRMSVVFDVSGDVVDVPAWQGQRPTQRSCVGNALVDAHLEAPPTDRYVVELDSRATTIYGSGPKRRRTTRATRRPATPRRSPGLARTTPAS